MKKKHLRCLLVLLVAVCMVCSIAVPVCAEVLPSAQIGTPETALESDTEKDNTPTPTRRPPRKPPRLRPRRWMKSPLCCTAICPMRRQATT